MAWSWASWLSGEDQKKEKSTDQYSLQPQPVSLETATPQPVVEQPPQPAPSPAPEPVAHAATPSGPPEPIGKPPPNTELVPDPEKPDAVLFRRGDTGFKTPQGLLVSILQHALKLAGHLPGEVDGIYGAATERGVAAFQKERNVTATGDLTESDWLELTGMPVPSVFDRILQVTASFEGHGFELVVGNFDGAFITWGITGYTLKHDLPGFIERIDRQHPGLVAKAFKQKEKQLRRVLLASNTVKESWANSISIKPRKYHVRSDWKAAFARFGRFPEVQRLQIADVRERIWEKIALRDARRWGASDALDMAVWFDTAVQNGGGGRSTISEPLDRFMKNEPDLMGEDRRLHWARIIADGSNPRYINDVYSRRQTMATGFGTVHGAKYQLEDWGLTPTFKVDLEELDDVHATFTPPALHQEQASPTTKPEIEPKILDTETDEPRAPNVLAYPLARELPVASLPAEMRRDINKGLNGTGNNLMISILGRPKGSIGVNCSSSGLYPNFKKHIVWGIDVGPFKVTGLRPAVELLKKVMDDIRVEEPEIYESLSSAGMLCVRRVRGGKSISNHSWGTAIDLMINGKLDARGDNEVQYGLTRIYPIFNRHGFYWGIDFRTEDAMHFEISRQKMQEWHAAGVFGSRSSLPRIATMLDIGDRGPEVRKLQEDLNVILDADIEVDGHFGQITRTLVLDFQRNNNLEVDGVAGPKTLKAISDAIAAAKAATA